GQDTLGTMKFDIDLTTAQAERLRQEAERLKITPEEGHPFVDGNKRTGHAAMATFLLLNGADIDATIDQQEQIILALASGRMNRQEFAEWLNQHVRTAADS